MMSFNKYLFLFAHMDDETLLSYGLIRKLLERKCNVSLICMCGNSRKHDVNAIKRQKVFDTMFDKFTINQMRYSNYDLQLDAKKAKEQIHEAIEAIQPEAIITHSSCDLHFEHKMISEIVHLECRMKPGSRVKALYETALPQEFWNFSENAQFKPNTFVDISKFKVDKMKALKRYNFELPCDPNDLRSSYAIQTMNQHYGQVIGVSSCEAYRQQFLVA